MTASNNEKTFICVSFCAANEKLLCFTITLLLYNLNIIFFGEKSKNQDKLIQYGTSGPHTKNRDS